MTRVLHHRGPDGEGFYINNNVGLGHRRLSIIDLATGTQPMFSNDKALIVVFNGEIYNYIEIREELKSLGHVFSTTSDTEVILNAYARWGFDCQNKFNGMWAFALWDTRQKLLFISRDRIGEKPLHYSIRDNTFFFGSEIKSIIASGHEYEPRDDMYHLYLSLGYIPSPYTFYKGIEELSPGHYLVVKNGRVADLTYWDLPSIREEDMRVDTARIHEEFEHIFYDSVKIRMRSDVPFGAFLSGGMDSASVVAGMSQTASSPVETFTIGFNEKRFDEREIARDASNHFKTLHHEYLVNQGTFDDSLAKIIFHFDEPFGDASAIVVGLVSGLASQKVKVALTGDGGDEILAGYTIYSVEKLVDYYSRVPSWIKSGMYNLTDAVSQVARHESGYFFNRLKRFLFLSDKSFEDRFLFKMASTDPESIRQLIQIDSPQVPTEDYFCDLLSKPKFKDSFYKMMYFNLKSTLPDDMLTKVDRMSMAHSLETRVPFLDYRLIELTYCVSKDVKLPRLGQKELLKKTIGRKLPPSMLRVPKRAFRVPLREWFKDSKFTVRLNHLETCGFGLDGSVIAGIVRANAEGRQDHGDFIWRLFVLESWLKGLGEGRVLSEGNGQCKPGLASRIEVSAPLMAPPLRAMPESGHKGSQKDMEHITICICTYKRQKMLRSLLGALQGLKGSESFTHSIVVVDNDAEQSAKHVVQGFNFDPVRVTYLCEPKQNIALARNMAVKNAQGDYLAFIDDDELPVSDWLLQLHKAIKSFGVGRRTWACVPEF